MCLGESTSAFACVCVCMCMCACVCICVHEYANVCEHTNICLNLYSTFRKEIYENTSGKAFLVHFMKVFVYLCTLYI